MLSTEFVEKIFSDFYKNEAKSVNPPSMIERREFGFLLFAERGMLRHKGFNFVDDLRSFLENMPVSDAYYSCAYYERPEADMDRKGWLGADLIFDIDADHIPTPCDKAHDEWVCGKCNFAGKGTAPKKCPVCGGEGFDANTWPCDVCLDSAKGETIKLLDILMRDFGFSEKEVRVFFSGHRGYHVHVESEAVKTLDAVARKEIVDYVCGLGFDAAAYGLLEKGWRISRFLTGLKLDDFGLRGRVAKGMYNLIRDAKEEDYRNIGLKKNVAESIEKNKSKILSSWGGVGPWYVVKGIGFGTWRKIAEFCAGSQFVKVDTVVTTDIHRLIRLANTLHGKTGFKKIEFSLSEIEGFDPFKSALAFKKGTATVFVSDAPEFRLGDETFGPYKSQKIELPTAAAVLLVCKGRAEVVE